MWIRVCGAALDGVEGVRVEVEAGSSRGLPGLFIVGQPDRVVAESRDRVRSALSALEIKAAESRVTISLLPSDVRKSGAALDLPIAVAVAACKRPLDRARLDGLLLLGEVGLDGRLHPVRGVLALLIGAQRTLAGRPLARAIVPTANLAEAALCPGLEVRGADTLRDVLATLDPEVEAEPLHEPRPAAARATPADPDLADVIGQEGPRRALEVAAAGGHNLVLYGPPGAGKSLLARRLPGLLPDLDEDAALDATRIHSVAGTLPRADLMRRPPFRAPHHTTSDAGLLGGGRPLRPGELTLAHRGVLFLDELLEFRRPALEALRQPLEEGEVRLARAHGRVRLPARFQLAAAFNPCPCGYLGDPSRECTCPETLIERYRSRLSGPLLDRIDLHVAVPSVPWRILRRGGSGESSRAVRARVAEARARQARRLRDQPWGINAEIPARPGDGSVALDGAAERLLERAVGGLGLSVRAVVRVLRVARTLADLAGRDRPGSEDLAEALGWRALGAGDPP